MSSWDISNAGKLGFLIALIVGSVGAGYLARRGGLGERAARRLMYFVITVPYAVVGFLAIWVLHFEPRFVALPVMGFTIMAATTGLAMAAARRLRLERPTAGAFVLVAGASNLGFTMGGFVNFVLFGQQGLALAAMFTMFWDFGMVLILYPVARHYGESPGAAMWKLILANFRDVRALPFYCTLTGLTLNLLGVPRPGVFGQAILSKLTIVDVLMLLGAAVSFFTTGLRLHLGYLHVHGKLHVVVAAIKYIASPAVAAGLLALLALVGLPMPDPAWKVVMVQASTPVAIYAVVISNLFRLDDRLASIAFVVNTGCYLALILPVVVMVFG